MKKIQKYSVLFLVICSHATHGMLVNKKCAQVLKAAGNLHLFFKKETNGYGLVTALMPQTAKGALGQFRLDKLYGVRDYLGQYIAFNEKISLQEARWENFDAIQKAYKQFLSHNSSVAIQTALNNNTIDTDYAVKSLYFTHKVVTELQEHIEYQQDFAHRYSNDPEQYIWVDENAFNAERKCLLKDAQQERAAIVKLVDFLQQKPVNESFKVNAYSMFKSEESSYGWTFSLDLSRSEKLITPSRLAHVHDGVLGTFDPHQKYTIQEYLKKYLDKIDDKVEWRALKKAYNDFLFYNKPSHIRHVFETSEKIKNKEIKMLWSSYHVVENVTKKEVEQALLFTRDVAGAMRRYLGLDRDIDIDCVFYDNGDCCGDCACVADLYNQSHKLEDEDVELFAQLGTEPATRVQTRDGFLGNFTLSEKQNGIQDYLGKYIARNLQIPEYAVTTEATFLDIKKAFDQFITHNHPDAILRDFENKSIDKQHAQDALSFTFCVIDALQEYLAKFKDDSYEMELFDLFWKIERMKEKRQGMAFAESGRE